MRVIEEYGALKLTSGEVGVEIEVEGEGVSGVRVVGWNNVGDGSLRGESAEFVMTRPVSRKKVKALLYSLHKGLNNGRMISRSDRTGVHVHVNCQQLTFEETLKFILLFLVFEQLLVNYCGDSREGNLFCLRSSDAEAMLDALHQAVIRGSFRNMQSSHWRYSALNVTSLSKYGSIEFRSLATPTDVREVEKWVTLLTTLFDKARELPTVVSVIEKVSVENGVNYVRSMLGKNAPLLLDNVNIDINLALMDGAQRVQDIAYAYEDSKWNHDVPTKKGARKKKRGQSFDTYDSEPIIRRGFDATTTSTWASLSTPRPDITLQPSEDIEDEAPAPDRRSPGPTSVERGREWVRMRMAQEAAVATRRPRRS